MRSDIEIAQAAQMKRISALAADLGLALVEEVAGALEEQHAEDVFLVLAGIHVAAQVIAGGQQQLFKAGKGEAGAGHQEWRSARGPGGGARRWQILPAGGADPLSAGVPGQHGGGIGCIRGRIVRGPRPTMARCVRRRAPEGFPSSTARRRRRIVQH